MNLHRFLIFLLLCALCVIAHGQAQLSTTASTNNALMSIESLNKNRYVRLSAGASDTLTMSTMKYLYALYFYQTQSNDTVIVRQTTTSNGDTLFYCVGGGSDPQAVLFTKPIDSTKTILTSKKGGAFGWIYRSTPF